MKTLRNLLLGFSLAIAAISNAQMPEPSAEVKALDWLVGEWTATVKWTAMGANTDAVTTWNVERNGLFLKNSISTEMMGMKMLDTVYTGWDSKKKKYFAHTFTNYVSVPRIEWGDLKNDTLTMVSDPWPASPASDIVGRHTFTKKGEDIYYLLEFKNADKWDKAAEGLFKKKK